MTEQEMETVKRNSVMIEKRTMTEYLCVSITSYDESTKKVTERAREIYKEDLDG